LRLFGAIGFGICSLFGGLLTNVKNIKVIDFIYIFYLNFIFSLATLFVIKFIINLNKHSFGMSNSSNNINNNNNSNNSDLALVYNVVNIHDKGCDQGEIYLEMNEDFIDNLQYIKIDSNSNSNESINIIEIDNIDKEKITVFYQILNILKSDPLIILFFIVILLSGFGSGVIDSFLFIRLKQLGGKIE
jgi:hypothetical protein